MRLAKSTVALLVVMVAIPVVGLLLSGHNVEVMRFSGSQSPVFAINGSSKDYFLKPISQTNFNLCSDPTIANLYRQGDAVPVLNGQVTYYLGSSGGQNSHFEVNWNSMVLPDGLAPGNYYFLVQQPSCRTGVTLALFRASR